MKMVNCGVRIPTETHDALQRIAKKVAEESGEPPNICHVIRMACLAYVRENDPLPIRDALHVEPERPRS